MMMNNEYKILSDITSFFSISSLQQRNQDASQGTFFGVTFHGNDAIFIWRCPSWGRRTLQKRGASGGETTLSAVFSHSSR